MNENSFTTLKHKGHNFAVNGRTAKGYHPPKFKQDRSLHMAYELSLTYLTTYLQRYKLELSKASENITCVKIRTYNHRSIYIPSQFLSTHMKYCRQCVSGGGAPRDSTQQCQMVLTGMEHAEQKGDRTKPPEDHNCYSHTSDARTARDVNEVAHD
jgi:hypothetical protein